MLQETVTQDLHWLLVIVSFFAYHFLKQKVEQMDLMFVFMNAL